MSPIFVSLILMIFIGIEEASNWLSLNLKIKIIKKNIKYVVVDFVSIWLMFPLYVVYDNISKDMRIDAGGYNTTSWRNSEVIEWVINNKMNCEFYSNAPDALYFLADVVSQYSPEKNTNLSQFEESM